MTKQKPGEIDFHMTKQKPDEQRTRNTVRRLVIFVTDFDDQFVIGGVSGQAPLL